MKLSELLVDLPVEIIKIEGSTDIEINDLSFHSKKIGEKSIFFCVEGLGVDRHLYAADAQKSGCKVVVLRYDVELQPGITKIFVANVRSVMAHMAGKFYDHPDRKLKLIGITGTNGKTTISYFIRSILVSWGKKTGVIGTIVNLIGDLRVPATHTTPESVDLALLLKRMVDADVEYVVMEVSSHSLALDRVDGIDFDAGVFTNLTRDHLDFHKNFDNYREAKSKLFDQSKLAVLNADDNCGRLFSERFSDKAVTYGISYNADYFARDLEITEQGVSFCCIIDEHEFEIDLKIPGIFSVYNALAAAGVCYKLGVPIEAIKEGLETVTVPGRFERLNTGTDYSVILDYAHTPDGLENILQTANQFAKARTVTLFGCGGDRDVEKRPMMGYMAGKYSDFCIVTSDNPRSEEPMAIINQLLPGVIKTKCEYVVIENRREAIKYALDNAQKDDVIILAGKGHENYQILSDDTVIHFDEKEIVMELLGIKL